MHRKCCVLQLYLVTTIRIFRSNQPWVNSKQMTIEQAEETKCLFQIILNSKDTLLFGHFSLIKTTCLGSNYLDY